jgi:transcriptional regulator of arginine metabolism
MTVDEAILDLIEQQAVPDQATLLTLLAAQGHRLTQPTLSRHLKKLSVVKRGGRYQRVERGSAERPSYSVIESPPNMIIIKTAPGHAQVLGVIIDRAGVSGIAGTLAGDDTVFIAVTSGDLRVPVRDAIEKALG